MRGPWAPLLISHIPKVGGWLEEKLGKKFNFALVNYYSDGSKYIGFHSDAVKSLKKDDNWGVTIFSLTFGATRDFIFKSIKTKENWKIPLTNNTGLMMGGATQKNYKHAVPKRKNVKEGRINITFRQVIVKE